MAPELSPRPGEIIGGAMNAMISTADICTQRDVASVLITAAPIVAAAEGRACLCKGLAHERIRETQGG